MLIFGSCRRPKLNCGKSPRVRMGEAEKTRKFGSNSVELDEFGPRLKLLKSNNQIRELQTIIRNK